MRCWHLMGLRRDIQLLKCQTNQYNIIFLMNEEGKPDSFMICLVLII